MRALAMIFALHLAACAVRTSTTSSTLCTIEDQTAGLCDGPMTRAYQAAEAAGYDPYNDPRVIAACVGNGSCFVMVTNIGGQCKNWYASCNAGSCTTGCVSNPNGPPPVYPLTGPDESSRTGDSSFCPVGDECQSLPLRNYGDAYLAQNYPEAKKEGDWDCYDTSQQIWCSRHVRLDYYAQNFECVEVEQEYPVHSVSYYCYLGADLAPAGR